MAIQERAGPHTSTSWSPREKTGTYSQHATTKLSSGVQAGTYMLTQPNIETHGNIRDIHADTIPCVQQLHAFTPIQKGRPIYTKGASHMQTHILQA